ncbi:MAG: agmatine deiminase family protein [Bacteroidales bacterium]|jgi:agmatine/peptidylarginine deiminase|nr:agmatine deiminase family protein [Bacteroidales bacterium]
MNRFPAEWELQNVMIAWPDEQTDWASTLHDILPVYEQLATEILRTGARLLVICRNRQQLPESIAGNGAVVIREIPFNDTWVRDYAPLTVLRDDGSLCLLKFGFNGWGLKYPANLDNQVAVALEKAKAFDGNPARTCEIKYRNLFWFVLEGGSIETNGCGDILTTTKCLCAPNRNDNYKKDNFETVFAKNLYSKNVIWLNQGYLVGDDTDSHIDMLARFFSPDGIVHVSCANPADEHYDGLQAMADELAAATDHNGAPFRIEKLPMPDPVYDRDGQRMPASYANFLELTDAVLFPVYGVDQDADAMAVMQRLRPASEIIPVNARPLIMQRGAIHCATMKYPQQII